MRAAHTESELRRIVEELLPGPDPEAVIWLEACLGQMSAGDVDVDFGPNESELRRAHGWSRTTGDAVRERVAGYLDRALPEAADWIREAERKKQETVPTRGG